MGNTKSVKLKELYSQGRTEPVQSENEKLIGNFTVMRIQGFSDELFILKVLDPKSYDQYADIQQFLRRLSSSNPSIADFFFISASKSSKELFDLLFEFGPSVDAPVAAEKDFWAILEQTSEGLASMEAGQLHYPIVARKYVIRTSKGKVKLLNPYCFPDFVKEVLQVYLNPQNPISNRAKYLTLQVQRNIKEFGTFALTLLGNFNEYQLKVDQKYLAKAIEGIYGRFSKRTSELLWALSFSQVQPKSLRELAHFVQAKKAEFFSDASGFFSAHSIDQRKQVPGIQSSIQIDVSSRQRAETFQTGKNANSVSVENFIEKAKGSPNSSILTDKSQNPKLYGQNKAESRPKKISLAFNEGKKDSLFAKKIVEENPKKNSKVPSKPILKQNETLGSKASLPIAHRDSKAKIQTPVKRDSYLKKFMNFSEKNNLVSKIGLTDINQENQAQNLDSLRFFDFNGEQSNKKIKAQIENQTQADVLQTHRKQINLDKETFFSEKQTEIQQKRSSLVSIPVLSEGLKATNLEFVNTSQTSAKNITQYLKSQDKGLQGAFNFFESDLKVNPYIENKSSLSSQKQADKNPEKGQEGSKEAQMRPKSNTENQIIPPIKSSMIDKSFSVEIQEKASVLQNTSTSENKPVVQNLTNKTEKKAVKRIIMKWLVDQKRHIKMIEYEDGTLEEATDELPDNKQGRSISSPGPLPQEQIPRVPPQTSLTPEEPPSSNFPGKNTSNPFNGKNESELVLASLVHFILIPENDQPALLLFRSKQNVASQKYKEIAKIVNNAQPGCPSCYHGVEEERKAAVYLAEKRDKARSVTPRKYALENLSLVNPKSLKMGEIHNQQIKIEGKN